MTITESQEILEYLVSQKRGMGIEQVAALTFHPKRTKNALFYYELIDMALNALHTLFDRHHLSPYQFVFDGWHGRDMVLSMPDRIELPVIKKPKGNSKTNGLIIDF